MTIDDLRWQSGFRSVIDLPGEWEFSLSTEARLFMSDLTMLRVTQTFRPGRVLAGFMTIPNDVLVASDPAWLGAMVGHMAERTFKPWLWPDRPDWPDFEPFPRATAAWRWCRRLVRAR